MKYLQILSKELLMNRRCHIQRQLKMSVHLICFKNWSRDMVLEIISSAINLKCHLRDTHFKQLDVLKNTKVMVMQEVNEPVLGMAVSKASTLLGASDVTVVDHLLWDCDYLGRVFSMMCDVIFVTTSTHTCVERFAEQSTAPVLSMRSRAHASLQALATVMATIEEYGSMECLNIGYVGNPHPVLNSYLLLCPMLGANIKFKCCCAKCPVSPLLYKISQNMTKRSQTVLKQCLKKDDVLGNASVIIAGPTSQNEDKIKEFHVTAEDMERKCSNNWIFFHTCPRGREVDDKLFMHDNAKTFNSFNNMQYIAAALMVKTVMGLVF